MTEYKVWPFRSAPPRLSQFVIRALRSKKNGDFQVDRFVHTDITGGLFHLNLSPKPMSMSSGPSLIFSTFARRVCALGALVFVTAAAHAQWANLEDFKANPSKTVEVSGTKALQVSNK